MCTVREICAQQQRDNHSKQEKHTLKERCTQKGRDEHNRRYMTMASETHTVRHRCAAHIVGEMCTARKGGKATGDMCTVRGSHTER